MNIFKKFFEKINSIKISPIRPDLAKHEFVCGYINWGMMLWIATTWGVTAGIISGLSLILFWFLFEVAQKLTDTGTFDMSDWFASSRSAFMMLSMLLVVHFF